MEAVGRVGQDAHMSDRSRLTALGAVAPAWLPVALVIAAALVPVLRLPVSR
jgi:hypothetical protein